MTAVLLELLQGVLSLHKAQLHPSCIWPKAPAKSETVNLNPVPNLPCVTQNTTGLLVFLLEEVSKPLNIHREGRLELHDCAEMVMGSCAHPFYKQGQELR